MSLENGQISERLAMGATGERMRIAVVGTGISGLSAAWLLSRHHDVTVFERAERLGGHSNTVEVRTDRGAVPVDTGFIVYNEKTYPNLVALFRELDVATEASEMSFAVSLRNGALEYGGSTLTTLFAQKRNLLRPRFWSMLLDLRRFYRDAPSDIFALDPVTATLGDYLTGQKFGAAFRDDHLLPMAAAIWSAPAQSMLDYPAAAFIRFHDNHGLLKISDRPVWRTVKAGSREYVAKMARAFSGNIRLTSDIVSVRRHQDGVEVRDRTGHSARFDQVVLASHANQALAMLDDPSVQERSLLSAFRYSRNLAVLHSDDSLMPKRRKVWSSWNYIGERLSNDGQMPTVTYWMNRLQNLQSDKPIFATLNPARPPHADTIFNSEIYHHPMFDSAAIAAQRQLWSLQGRNRTWFCGSYFGSGFHEDGLQSGLAVAEGIGGVRRPWAIENEFEPHPPSIQRTGCDRGGCLMGWRSSLYVGSVMHRRVRPRAHKLRYRVFWLLLNLDEVEQVSRKLRLFSSERFNLFSFFNRDHGDGSARPLRAQVEQQLRKAGIDTEGGRIELLCMPRILGYGFNPISVYYCYGSAGELAALVYQVHNTFGERHSYLIKVDRAGSGMVLQRCDKAFYVSPFLGMDMSYEFRIVPPGERAVVSILGADAKGPLIVASLVGARRPLNDRALVGVFLTHPLLTLKVMAGIYWEALRLWLKGVRLVPRKPGTSSFTIVQEVEAHRG